MALVVSIVTSDGVEWNGRMCRMCILGMNAIQVSFVECFSRIVSSGKKTVYGIFWGEKTVLLVWGTVYGIILGGRGRFCWYGVL